MDRSECRYCKKVIGWIVTTKGARMPVDPHLVKVDGEKLLVFPDGATARRHLGFIGGYVSHFATCEVWLRIQANKRAAKKATLARSQR